MRAPSALAKLLRLCDGNVAMTFALSMPIVVGGAGIVVDNGVWKFQRTTLQEVADQAALAGAAVLNDTNHATAAARQAAAVAAANDVVFAQRPDLTPTIQAGADHRSISVSLSEKGIVSFAGVFGLERVDIPVTGHAVVDRAAGAACLLALNEGGQTTGITFAGTATVSARGCAVWSNAPSRKSIVVQGAAKVAADRLCAAGDIAVNGGTPAAGAVRAGRCGALADPLATWSVAPPAGCDKTNHRVSSSGDVTLWPGVYCNGLDVSGQGTVTLMPGEYYVRNGPLRIVAGGSVIGDDVGIYLHGAGAAAEISGQQKVRLRARAVGDLRGKAIASDRRATGNPASKIGGGTLDLVGTVYLPGHALTVAGHSSGSANVAQVIADTIELSGTTSIALKADFDAAGYPKVVSMIPAVRLSK